MEYLVILSVLLPLAALSSAPLQVRALRAHLASIRQDDADWDVQDAIEARALAAGISAEDADALARITEAPPVQGPVLAHPWRLGIGVSVALSMVFAALVARLPSPWLLLPFCGAAALGALLFVVDARTKRLPLSLIWACYVQALILLPVAGLGSGEWHPWRALASAGVWGLVFFLPWLITAGRGMGFGDVQLAPVIGLLLGWLGWGASLVGLFSGFVFGGIVGAALLVRGRATRKTAIPYGPFLLAGALLGALFGETVLDAYMSFTGLVAPGVSVLGDLAPGLAGVLF